ncbi:helix-turn-helix domain-containing protein [Tautonia plasticadhaerens]|uniref:Transcriptional repressor DicA n=1 Tax=Tautonia plasticadhaerens TaxID=2527974 RepID=A0A518HEJ6_9BACT|nr:XRE family transcriptional regulator [Tautonia plasticadhaerens]QDV39275.1 transcriptional repressor DicA [Tautonia plasticadhaerens]
MTTQAARHREPIGIGPLIRKQREATRMTVAHLAQRIGVSRNTITNYESGKTEPSAGDLVRIADALGCPLVALLGDDVAPPPPRFAFRAHTALRKDPSIILMVRRYLRAYSEIEEIAGVRLPGALRQFVLDADGPLGDRDIEMAADTLRESCGLRDCGPENIAGILEGLGVRCLFFDHDSRGLDGISTIQGDLMLVLLRDRTRNIERTIFSAAHELGHLVLHPHLFTAEARDDDPGRKYEEEANKFAGCFLVPSDDLVRIWREERLGRLPLFHALLLLKRVFRVSFFCLYRRVTELGLAKEEYPIFISQIKSWLGIGGKASMEDLEPEPLDPGALYRTTRFQRLVRSAFLQDLIGVAKVAELLQITVHDASEMTSDWLRPRDVLVDERPL